MHMRKGTLMLGAAAGAISLTVAFAVPAFAEDYASGGSRSCGPDQQAKVSTVISSSGQTSHGWTNSNGTFATAWQTGTSHYTYTGTRSVSSWSATTNRTFTAAASGCA